MAQVQTGQPEVVKTFLDRLVDRDFSTDDNSWLCYLVVAGVAAKSAQKGGSPLEIAMAAVDEAWSYGEEFAGEVIQRVSPLCAHSLEQGLLALLGGDLSSRNRDMVGAALRAVRLAVYDKKAAHEIAADCNIAAEASPGIESDNAVLNQVKSLAAGLIKR